MSKSTILDADLVEFFRSASSLDEKKDKLNEILLNSGIHLIVSGETDIGVTLILLTQHVDESLATERFGKELFYRISIGDGTVESYAELFSMNPRKLIRELSEKYISRQEEKYTEMFKKLQEAKENKENSDADAD